MEKTHLSLTGVLAQHLESIREIVSSNPAATQTEIAQKVCEALNLCDSRNGPPVRSCRRIPAASVKRERCQMHGTQE